MLSFLKSKDLRNRIIITLAMLVVYRIGTYIPLPGVDMQVVGTMFNQQQGGILGMFNLFAGGAVERMSLFALNVMPYISASIIMQLVAHSFDKYKALKKQGQIGRQKIEAHTRYLTLLLALFQGYGVCLILEGLSDGNAVLDPGLVFRFIGTLTLTAGTLFLTWLGEQVTERGIGNGVSLIIFAGIVAELPPAFWNMLELSSTGALPGFAGLLILVCALALIVFIVFIEQGQRRIPIQYPRHYNTNQNKSILPHFLPLKINPAGVIPPVFASAILLMPMSIINFFFSNAAVASAGGQPVPTGGGFIEDFVFKIAAQLGQGEPLYMVLYGICIVFFAFFYVPIVFNPVELSDNLKKSGGFVSGIRAGEQTSNYLNKIVYQLTLFGAFYLLLVCLVPEFLIGKFSIPFYFGGTSFLIIVGVALDTVGKVQGYILSQKYSGLMRKARIFGSPTS